MSVELLEQDDVILEADKIKEMPKADIHIKYYEDAIAKFIPWIKENIYASPDKKIRIRTKDIAKDMGKNFERKTDKDIYWGLKYTLFLDGIVVDSGTTSIIKGG